jgi:hypothetical protein
MDELHGIFTAYEMRIEHENPDIKEASKRSKKKGKQKEHSNKSDFSKDDEE